MSTGYYQKKKKGFKKRFVKGIKIFSKKKETKSENMHVKDIKIFLKKKKDEKFQYRCENHKNLSGDEKQRIAEHI